MELPTAWLRIAILLCATLQYKHCPHGSVHWTQYVHSLTDNLITYTTNRQNLLHGLDMLHMVISRAHKHCVSGLSRDDAPAINGKTWIVQKPCGKINGTFISNEVNKHRAMVTTWDIMVHEGLYINFTFQHLNLLPSVYECDAEYIAISTVQEQRVWVCGTIFPSSYYMLYYQGVLLFMKHPQTRSSFFLQYQACNLNPHVRSLTTEMMILHPDGHAIMADYFTPYTLTQQECVACQHTVIYSKALFIIQYAMTIVAPVELACYDINIYDGPSILLPKLKTSTTINNDFTKFIITTDFSTAFQITVEINIYASDKCLKLTPNSFKISIDGRKNIDSIFHTVQPGGELMTLPSKYCYELSYIVFCLYQLSIKEKYQTPKLMIEDLNFESPNTNDCSFGGLQMLPDKVTRTTRPAVICHKLPIIKDRKTGTLHMELPFRTYIAEQETANEPFMMLAFYSYKISGRTGRNDFVTLNITSSGCLAVAITCDPPMVRSKTITYTNHQKDNYKNIRPDIPHEIMCMKHLPITKDSLKWKWKVLRQFDRISTCQLYSNSNHSMTVIYLHGRASCVMIHRVPRYGAVLGKRNAPRYETVADLKNYKYCGFNYISKLNTRPEIKHGHRLNEYNTYNVNRFETRNRHYTGPNFATFKYSINVASDFTKFRDFYTLEFASGSKTSLIPVIPLTPKNMDLVLNNVEPHSGSYILQDLSTTIRTKSLQYNNTDSYVKISHYDVAYFHMYHVLPWMTLKGNSLLCTALQLLDLNFSHRHYNLIFLTLLLHVHLVHNMHLLQQMTLSVSRLTTELEDSVS